MAEVLQQITECKEKGGEPLNRVCQKVKYWLLNVANDKGEGWAVVCAPNVRMAQGIFLRQTKLLSPKILLLKELRYFGEEWQIVAEGRGYEGMTHDHY